MALLITADAKGVAPATAEARREVESVGKAATATADDMRTYAAANDQAAEAHRRATAAATGRAAAERDLQAAVARFAGMRSGLGDADSKAREADVRHYGEALDQLRAKHVPLFAAQKAYAANLDEISRAARVGAISEDERAAAALRAKTAYDAQVMALGGARTGTRLAAHEVTNLSFQMNDMAMMLASGQSPFIVMVQQGAQVSQIMGNRGLGSILPALAVGLRSMVNPTMLVLGAVTALGYGAGYVFAAMQEDVKSVDDVLADHEEHIRRLKDAWGEPARGLRDYASESTRIFGVLTRASGAELRTTLRAETRSILDTFGAASIADELGSESFQVDQRFNPFYDAIRKLADGAREGRPDIRAFREEVAAFADARGADEKLTILAAEILKASDNADQLERALKANKTALDEIARAAANASRRFEAFSEAQRRQYEANRPALSDREDALNTFSTQNGAARDREERDDAWRLYQERLARIREQEETARIPIPAFAPNREDALPAAADFLRSQEQQLERLRLEATLIGTTTAERERAIAALEAEQEIRERGIDVNGREAEAIRRNADEIARATGAVEKHAEAYAKAQKAGEDMIDSMVDKLASGDLLGALEDFGKDLLSQALELGVKNPLKNALYGKDDPTFETYGGLGGYAGALLGIGDSFKPNTTAGSFFGYSPAANSNVPAAANGNVAGGVAGQIWNYFTGKGLAPHQTAGIIGNLSAESGLNPFAVNPNGGASGLPQWLGPRLSGILSANGGAMPGVGGQLDYIWKELQTSENPVLKRLLAAPDVRSAAGAFAGFERAEGWTKNNPENIALWSKRLAASEQALTKFGSVTQASAQNLAGFGDGLGQMGKALSQFPAAPSGGIGGLLSKLFGGGLPSLSFMNSISPAATSVILAGGGGLYAKGGIADRPSIFAEAGTEAAVPLPDGRSIPVTMRYEPTRPATDYRPAKSEIHVHDHVGAAVSVEESDDGRGGRRADVVLEERVANALAKPRARRTMAATYSQRGRLVRR